MSGSVTYRGVPVKEFLASASEQEKDAYYAALLAYVEHHVGSLELSYPPPPARPAADDEERN